MSYSPEIFVEYEALKNKEKELDSYEHYIEFKSKSKDKEDILYAISEIKCQLKNEPIKFPKDLKIIMINTNSCAETSGNRRIRDILSHLNIEFWLSN